MPAHVVAGLGEERGAGEGGGREGGGGEGGGGGGGSGRGIKGDSMNDQAVVQVQKSCLFLIQGQGGNALDGGEECGEVEVGEEGLAL